MLNNCADGMNRFVIGKQAIVKLSNIMTIASATIVIVENALLLSPNRYVALIAVHTIMQKIMKR